MAIITTTFAGVGDADELLGRSEEQAQVVELLANARNRRGGSVLVSGDAGIGKTALLEFAGSLPGVRHLRLDGYEAESSMPFAAVQRLTLPLRDRLPVLPPRQRQALDVATGQVDGPAPDRYLVGLGVLGLLTTAAENSPVACLVDDAHLLDPESVDALAFVARRLEVEPVAIMFTARDEAGITERMGGIPEITLRGLDTGSALTLLSRSVSRPLDPAVAVAIAQATGGNPLALIDLGEDLSTQDLGSARLADDPVPIGRHLEALYLRRVRQAGTAVQEWILLAAADATGNTDLVAEAARILQLPDEPHDSAEIVGLVEVQTTIRFRHQLVRSAVYNAATGADRRRVHHALALAADRLGFVELEAWHAAKAAVGTDTAVAERLERAADLAARRGGFASRASILTQAAELTPQGGLRDARLVSAAEAALAVGAAQVANTLLDRVSDDVQDPVTRGRIIMVRVAVGLFLADGSTARAAELLVAAADEFHGHDPEREQQALLHAFEGCTQADRQMQNITTARLGERLGAGAMVLPGSRSVILRGLAALIGTPYEQAVPAARAAFEEITSLPDHEMMQMGAAMASLAAYLWDYEGSVSGLQRAAAAARDAGALQHLDSILWVNALVEAGRGTIRRATECDELVREVRRAMGYDGENVVNAAVMALTGASRSVVLMIADGAGAIGFGGVTTSAHAALAVSDIASRNYRDAYELLRPMINEPFIHVTPTYYPDFVEAACRSGHTDEASRYAHELSARAAVNGSRICRGLAERSLGLIDPNEIAETHYLSAIDALSGTVSEVDLARAHLLYGEWLRRAKRRREASDQLGLALTHFEHAGADIFLQRTQAELEAAGGSAPRARHPYTTSMTGQELAIARLAAEGQTNAEIASKLFISPNTVDYHLRKVFQKLGISSRRQLADQLSTLRE